jgi:hypothetical protein
VGMKIIDVEWLLFGCIVFLLKVIQLIVFFIIANRPKETYKEKAVGRWYDCSSVVNIVGFCVGIFVSENILCPK